MKTPHQPTTSGPWPTVAEHVVVATGDAEHPRNDSATAIELGDGRLLMVYMEFLPSEYFGMDIAPNHLVAVTSSDGGRTWHDKRVVAEAEPGDRSVYNPSLLRLPSGEILFFYLRYRKLEWGDPLRATGCLCRSTDHGASFGPPQHIWDDAPFGCANHTLIRLSSGRLVKNAERVPIWGQYPQTVSSSGCYVSDDDGHTWTAPESYVELPLRGAMEGHCAELSPQGRLLMTVRSQLGSVFQSYSSDGGSTWSPAQTTPMSAPESMPVLAQMPGGDRHVLIWNHSEFDPAHGHSGKRTPLTAAVTADGGQSWSVIGDLDNRSGWQLSNPACTFLSDGSALITYFASPIVRAEGEANYFFIEAASLEALLVPGSWFDDAAH